MDLHTFLSTNSFPSSLLSLYPNHTLYPWQISLLSSLHSTKNILYTAPTSAGKSLIFELFTLHRLTKSKKVLLILPFLSIVSEKHSHFQRLLPTIASVSDREWSDLTICTIERANNIINNLIQQQRLNEIELVVIDEVHFIGESGRGCVLELLLIKLMHISPQTQIISTSATLLNAKEIAEWMNAELFICTERPIELREYVKVKNTIYAKDGSIHRTIDFKSHPKDPDMLIPLCFEMLIHSHSTIIFCPSKDNAEKVALSISSLISAIPTTTDITNNRSILISTLSNLECGLDSILSKTLVKGIAFHHAGLTLEERVLIENAFKQGLISILCATPTLANGVNLPARRVLFRSPFIASTFLSPTVYTQMKGRAGRKGLDSIGESIVLCQEKEKLKVLRLMNSELDAVHSALGGGMRRLILEAVAGEFCKNVGELVEFAQRSLFYKQGGVAMDSEINIAIASLVESALVSVDLVKTRLGFAALSSGLPPDEALIVYEDVRVAMKGFVLENDLHCVYQVTPIYVNVNVDWSAYLNIWSGLGSLGHLVGERVGVQEGFLASAMAGRINKRNSNLVRIHERFYAALMLNDLLNEMPLDSVCTKYAVNRGTLQSLQTASSTFAGMVCVFCKSLGWMNLAVLLEQFQERLIFGVGLEIVHLAKLPGVGGRRARVLWEGGYRQVKDVAMVGVEKVLECLLSGVAFGTSKELYKRKQEEERKVAEDAVAFAREMCGEVEERKWVELDKECWKKVRVELRNGSCAVAMDKTRLAIALNGSNAYYIELSNGLLDSVLSVIYSCKVIVFHRVELPLDYGKMQEVVDVAMLLCLSHPEEQSPKLVDVLPPAYRVTNDPIESICNCASGIYFLFKSISNRIQENGSLSYYESIEQSLTGVLYSMETVGILIDSERLNSIHTSLEQKIQTIIKASHVLVGWAVDLSSNASISKVLYETLGLTKISTNLTRSTLETLAQSHPFPILVNDYRHLHTILTNQIIPLTNSIHNNRIYPRYDRYSLTGRMYSTLPNIQNIPTVIDLGHISLYPRSVVIAPSNHLFISADYRQIELRLLAHFSTDPVLLSHFPKPRPNAVNGDKPVDVFTVSAKELGMERKKAKCIWYGIIYGMGCASLAVELGVSEEKAQAIIDQFHCKYSKVRELEGKVMRDLERDGWVESLKGRRRYFEGVGVAGNGVGGTSGKVKRQAFNTLLQASAADVVKEAMLRISNGMKEKGLSGRIVLNVHDEVILECRAEEVEECKELMRVEMTREKLNVPLEVELRVGESWEALKK